MSATRILIVDDEQDIRDLISDILSDEGHQVMTAADAASAREYYREHSLDLVLLDIWMPDVDGISLLQEWQADAGLKCPIVMMSGHGNVETAVQATRLGALDFIEKPLSLSKLMATVNEALEHGKNSGNDASAAVTGTQQQRQTFPVIADPAGKSKLRERLRRQLKTYADHTGHVALIGPDGTMKQHLAVWIHQHSGLRELPLALFDCELGHGLTQEPLPDSGTLIISHCAQLSQAEQQLLVDWTTASDRQRRLLITVELTLEQLLEHGLLLPALQQCCTELQLSIPPLSAHPEDIPDLIRHYTDMLPDAHQLDYRHISLSAQNRLRQQHWPGNERQLSRFIHQLLLLGGEGEISLDEVEQQLANYPLEILHDARANIFQQPLRQAREDFEREYLTYHLQQAHGSVGDMADRVGMERTHLYRKLRGLGINPKTVVNP